MDKKNRIGFSPKINDPAMAGYVRNANSWSAIFALIIGVIAVAGFYIAGETSSDMKNPEALYIGFGVGSMFMLIALFQIIGRKRSKTWDGTVVEKKYSTSAGAQVMMITGRTIRNMLFTSAAMQERFIQSVQMMTTPNTITTWQGIE